ncbi:type III-B CRISPR module-associated protein Cmr3 [Porphyromonas circumdentaria]|uniref:type III-B CRISPR module-associated protein Cmr3 n=1 Tax=Porphyromonas circumdentaria TaxID=29524 RepID=UPI0026DCE6A0|nr:type III-B CRISPR module-associated protein Cmr3 [Porphyromonas circumdentaria]MDO4722883.1 type III-B CRISPR module-associated protein Cmr3 [Porphyromonas circumdentaria]
MSTYLIKLTPLDKFFFGQKKTFGDDNADYFVYSSHFPQQTALLGLLRYQLLQIAGEDVFKDNKIQDKNKAGELIGEQSFSPFAGKKLEFGVIQSLSPVFIIDKKKNNEGKEEHFLPVGRRFQKKEEEKEEKEKKDAYSLLHLSCEAGCPPIFERRGSPEEKEEAAYDPKKGMASCWLSSNGTTLLNEEDFFIKDERIGIRKDYKGATNDDAFFRQRYYHFKNFKELKSEKTNECKQSPVREHDFCFATILEIKREIEYKELDKRIVYLGGERQPFLMEVREKTEDLQLNIKGSALTSDEKHYTVVLLSDAKIEPNHLKGVKFASTEVKDFACLLTHVGTQRFYNKKKKREEQSLKEAETALSHQHELYARGSVFYFDTKEQADKFCKELKEVPNFYTIGYNHAEIVNPSKTIK